MPDEGNYLVISTSDDHTVKMWALDGQVVQQFKGHVAPVNCGLISIHNMLMTGSDDKTIRVWDLRNGKEMRCIQGFAHPTLSLALRQTKPHIVSVSLGGTLDISDWQTGQRLSSTACQDGPGCSVLIMPNDRYAIFGGWASRNKPAIRIVRLEDAEPVGTLTGHASNINTLALASDGRIISGSSDETVRVWSAKTGECVRVFYGHQGAVSDLQVISTARGTYAISVGADDTLRVWNIDQGQCLRDIRLGHWLPDYPDEYNLNRSRPVLALVPSGLACTASTADYTIKLWDLGRASQPHIISLRNAHNGAITDLMVIEDYRTRLASLVTRLLRPVTG